MSSVITRSFRQHFWLVSLPFFICCNYFSPLAGPSHGRAGKFQPWRNQYHFIEACRPRSGRRPVRRTRLGSRWNAIWQKNTISRENDKGKLKVPAKCLWNLISLRQKINQAFLDYGIRTHHFSRTRELRGVVLACLRVTFRQSSNQRLPYKLVYRTKY